MEGYQISKSWLSHRIEADDPEWAWAIEELRPDLQDGDEIWSFDDPAPDGIHAGAMGLSLVRDGEPIRAIACREY
jgi:hypothetical protein